MGMDFNEWEIMIWESVRLDRKYRAEKSGVGLPLTEGGMHKK